MGKGQKLRMAATGAAAPTPAPPTPMSRADLLKPTETVFVPGKGLVVVGAPPAPSSSSTLKSSKSASSAPIRVDFDINAFMTMGTSDKMDILGKLFLVEGTPTSISSKDETNTLVMQKLVSQMEAISIQSDKTAQKASSKVAKITTVITFPSNILDISTIMLQFGLISDEGNFVIQKMDEQLVSNESSFNERGLYLLKSLLLLFGKGVEPFAMIHLAKLLTFQMDRSPSIRDTAADILTLLGGMICPYSIYDVYEILVPAMQEEVDWKVKVAALKLLRQMAPRVAGLISPLLPQIIPQVSECIGSAKKQVQSEAVDALTAACSAISNEDISGLVPQLVSVIARPDECAVTLDALLETTFVSTVDAPTLALLTPLLSKALRGRSSVLWRKAAKIIDNMCKLVNVSSDVAPFVPLLLPALEKAIDEVSDPEVCEVAKDARESLLRAVNGQSMARPRSGSYQDVLSSTSKEKVLSAARGLLEALQFGLSPRLSLDLNTPNALVICRYIAKVTSYVVAYYTAELENNGGDKITLPEGIDAEPWRFVVSRIPIDTWVETTEHYLKPLLFTLSVSLNKKRAASIVDDELPENGDQAPMSPSRAVLDDIPTAEDLSHLYRTSALGGIPDTQEDDDAYGSNLCNIKFSLAFGGKTLLYNTHLKLGRGRKYGVMGKNGTGKTTLLTNIGTGNIEGLPSELRTVYVQHDDPTDDRGVPLLQELISGRDLVRLGVTADEARDALLKINFTEEMLAAPRSSLSGGWKMKLLIIRAMLMRADVLLLDEPTNHLDTASVEWLMNYLKSQSELTCLIVSHDTLFLDAVVTDIIHYEHKKLVYYHGTLSDFVKIHPEAKYYYELDASSLKFVFPTPGRLDGINSTSRAILKMDNVRYTYPGATSPTISNVSVKVCLGSRIAVRGVNGAGKSTLIKLLVQETEPDVGPDGNPIGEVWKHHNLRIAYVAQHSFHHVEQHLDESPVDYMKQRFKGGVDSEDLAKVTVRVTDAELEERKAAQTYGDVLDIIGRRKNGRTMEYECTFVGQTKKDPNKYIAMETLIDMGLGKLVQQADSKVAALAAGLDVRPLLNKEIQGHLDEFNLEAEYGTHSNIRRLSGGQKVKLVLAAAMWNRPHVIVLDEPTNYLDREALGALTQAIKSFGGGVVIISHNKEFTDAICTETWMVENGTCTTDGEVEESTVNAISLRKQKKQEASSSAVECSDAEASIGNLNATKAAVEHLKNPKTLEPLTKVEIRKLTKLAQVAGVSLKEYVSKINKSSPEWKWLSSTIK